MCIRDRVCSVQCAVCSVQCAVCSVQCAVYRKQTAASSFCCHKSVQTFATFAKSWQLFENTLNHPYIPFCPYKILMWFYHILLKEDIVKLRWKEVILEFCILGSSLIRTINCNFTISYHFILHSHRWFSLYQIIFLVLIVISLYHITILLFVLIS